VKLLIILPFPETCGTLAARLEQFKGISMKKNLCLCLCPSLSLSLCGNTRIMFGFMTLDEEKEREKVQ